MNVRKLLPVVVSCLLIACNSTNRSADANKEGGKWAPTTPQETQMMDAVATEDEALEAIKAKNYALGRDKFQHALEAYQAVNGTGLDQAYCMWRLASTYYSLGDKAKATKTWEEAIARVDEAATASPAPQSDFIRRIRHDRVGGFIKGSWYYYLGHQAGEHSDFQTAKINMEQAITSLAAIQDPGQGTRDLLVQSYEMLASACERLSLSREAADAAQKAKQLRSAQ